MSLSRIRTNSHAGLRHQSVRSRASGFLCSFLAGYPNVQLGVIPKGTGNDFLKTFGDVSPFFDIEKQMKGSVVKIDAIKAGDYYALNQASMGMDAAVCYHKSRLGRIPFVKGQGAYVIALLYTFLFSLNPLVASIISFLYDNQALRDQNILLRPNHYHQI